MSERNSQYEKIVSLIRHKDFKGLDLLFSSVRSPNAIDSSGVPYLEYAYGSLEAGAASYIQNLPCGASEQKMAEDWVRYDPKSTAGHILYSDSLMTLAFCARGNNYSNKVAANQWPTYYRYLQEAYTYLVENKNDSYQDPEWFVEMEEIGIYQGWNEKNFMSLVNKAVEIYPLYYRIWYMGMIYYAPRWHGSATQTEAFARYASDTTSALMGPDLYARLYRWSNNFFKIDNMRTETQANWAYLKLSMKDITKKYPDISNIVHYAYMSCKYQDYKEMDYYIEKVTFADPWMKKLALDTKDCNGLINLELMPQTH